MCSSDLDFKSRVFPTSGTPSATLFDVPKINSNFKCDIDWYLRRIDKIETYYSQNSFSDWRNKIIVVSDDVDESWENIIQSTSNDIADLITENKPFFNAKKILADAFNQETSSGGERYPEVKSQLINGMKQGALVVNYFGHGGEDGKKGGHGKVNLDLSHKLIHIDSDHY